MHRGFRRRPHWPLAGLAALAAALAVACASGEGGGKPTVSPTPHGPVVGVDKASVDIGTVSRDFETTETFFIANYGSEPLTAGPASVRVEQGCNAVQVQSDSLTVAPGKGALLPVRLGAHKVAGPHVVRLDVPTNDPHTPTRTLTIRFTVDNATVPAATGPRLHVDKTVINTGVIPLDWPGYEQFTLRNIGDAPLVLEVPRSATALEGC